MRVGLRSVRGPETLVRCRRLALDQLVGIAAEQSVPGREVLIDANVVLVRHVGRVDGVAVDAAGVVVRQGDVAGQDTLRYGVDPGRGNHVARERLPGQRIEKRRRAAREVPGAEVRLRHGGGPGRAARDIEPLVGREEERAVAKHGPGQVAAVVVVLALVERRVLVEVVRVRVEEGVVVVPEDAAVPLVRARPGHGRDVADLGKLGGIVYRAHPDLLDAFDRRHKVDVLADAVAAYVGRRDPVDRHLVLVREAAGERELVAAALLHLGNRVDRLERRRVEGAEGEGQLLELPVRPRAGHRGRLGVDERRASAHGDLFGDGVGRQQRIHAHALSRFHGELLARERPEARERRGEPVAALRDVEEFELPLTAGDGRADDVGLHFGEGDRDTRRGSPCGVEHGAYDGAVGGLRVRDDRRREDRRQGKDQDRPRPTRTWREQASHVQTSNPKRRQAVKSCQRIVCRWGEKRYITTWAPTPR